MSNVWAQEGSSKTLSIALPTKSFILKKPSSDLVFNGGLLEVGEAAKLAESGFDISDLNPLENRMWQNNSYAVSDKNMDQFPSSEEGVQFESFEAATKFTSLIRVRTSKQVFRLGMSRYSQPMMMRAALLRKLGYFIPAPKYYHQIKIKFSSEEEKEKFINNAQLDTGSDFESRNWISEGSKSDHSLYINSATLELMSNDYFDLQWGLAPNPDDPRQVPMVQRYSRHRAYRALIFPYSLVDVPESVNRYSPRYVVVSAGYAIIPYFMADSFSACAYEDARWILKRLSKLTLSDFKEIVESSHYPQELKDLVLAKLIARVKDALKTFNITSNLPDLPIKITSPSGLVKNGKVTQEFVRGYPQRFSHGERNSPYQEGDFARYIGVDLRSSTIKNITQRMNDRLQLFTVEDAAQRYQQNLYNRIINHIHNNPGQPFYKEVASWGGPLAGLNVNASRHVSTGTYNGSTAPVQLVDNLSVSAGIGYFRALDGVEKYVPAIGSNVAVVRDYTHVRPILSLKEASSEEWKNLLVPRYMNTLSEVLLEPEGTNKEEIKQHALDMFLNNLRDGEVFTISDSVALSAFLSMNSSLDVLLGITPFNFINSVTLGADATRVILRQVSFHRVANDGFNGVHVYVREMKNKARGVEFNLNYYLHLLKIRAQSTEADIATDGFLVDYNPSLSAEVDPNTDIGKELTQTREKLRLALLPLFRDNDTELLYGQFENKKFAVKHNLKAKETKFKFLWWRFQSFNENHLLKIQYPKSSEHPDLNPEDEEITLFASRKGALRGRDILGFGFDTIEGIIANNDRDISIARNMGDNPANVPAGKAYWKLINSEADLSKNVETYPNISTVQHVWGGWSLSQKKFFKVIDEIEKQFSGSPIDFSRLIDRRDFLNMSSLDFYRVTANLSILDSGLNKIKSLLLQPNFLKNSNRKESDREFFDEMIRILGMGDYEKGLENYHYECQIEVRRRLGPQRGRASDYHKGQRYDCLTRWMKQLITLAHKYPSGDKIKETQWTTEVLSILDQHVPMAFILDYLEPENYIFLVRINGFRSGDEDGDLEYFSNTLGDPDQDYSYAGGLINMYIRKTGLMPTELDRTLGGFR